MALTEDEDSHLEVQLYSEDGNLYVHHDIYLPDFPLCLAWMDCPPFLVDGSQVNIGNYIAVGTFSPAIEIWNLDVLDPLEPTATLGGLNDASSGSSSKSGKKKGKKSAFAPGSHTEGVLSLSWNKTYRQVSVATDIFINKALTTNILCVAIVMKALASGSADQSVKIWDVTTQKCSFTFNHHSDKVRSLFVHSFPLQTNIIKLFIYFS